MSEPWMGLPTQEFLDDHAALVQMPEAENPDLYKRLRLLIDRRHARRPGGYAIGAGALTTPEARRDAAMRFGQELAAMFEKIQRQHAELERMSESQLAAMKAKADAEAEEDLAAGKVWARELYALVDEYRSMKGWEKRIGR